MARKTEGYIYKRGNIYWLAYKVNGKRVQLSLKTKDKHEAEQLKEEHLLPLITHNEIVHLKSIVHQLRDKEEEKAEIDLRNSPRLLLANTWNTYLSSPERPDTGKETLRQYKGQFKRFRLWAEQNSLRYLDDVNKELAKAYFHDLKRSNISANTLNKHIGGLQLASVCCLFRD